MDDKLKEDMKAEYEIDRTAELADSHLRECPECCYHYSYSLRECPKCGELWEQGGIK